MEVAWIVWSTLSLAAVAQGEKVTSCLPGGNLSFSMNEILNFHYSL